MRGWICSAQTYYKMILVYVDNILVFSQEPKAVWMSTEWAMSSKTCAKNAVGG